MEGPSKICLSPSDVIWWHTSGLTLAQVIIMACCLMAPGHYLNYLDLSPKVFCDIHLRVISKGMLTNVIYSMCSKITALKVQHSSEANELNPFQAASLPESPGCWDFLPNGRDFLTQITIFPTTSTQKDPTPQGNRIHGRKLGIEFWGTDK